MRQAARLKVQTAMKGLGLRLICRVGRGEQRATTVLLPSGYWCVIGQSGEVTQRFDLAEQMAKGLEGLEPGDEAAATATRMARWAEEILREKAPQFLADPDASIQDRVISGQGAAEIETRLRRQRQQAAKSSE